MIMFMTGRSPESSSSGACVLRTALIRVRVELSMACSSALEIGGPTLAAINAPPHSKTRH
jgi:hypothetical protein